MTNLIQEPVKKALYGKLAGDSTLVALLSTVRPEGYSQSIYAERAPEGAGFPYVVFSKQSGTPVSTFATGGSIYEDETWWFRAIDRTTNSDVAERIAKRVDELLVDASLSISGATLRYLRRTTDQSYSELVDGVRYVYRGGLYRLVFS